MFKEPTGDLQQKLFTRNFAGAILVFAKDRRVVEPLLQLLQERKDACGMAAEALGRLGEPRAVAPLLAIIKDYGKNDAQERYQRRDVVPRAMAALRKIGDKSVIPAILEATKDDQDRSFSYERASMVAWSKGEPPKDAPPSLTESIRTLKSEAHWLTRAQAAKLLGQAGGPEAAAALKSVLRDEHAEVRAAARQALKDMDSKTTK
jgi:HEAT repeat protein